MNKKEQVQQEIIELQKQIEAKQEELRDIDKPYFLKNPNYLLWEHIPNDGVYRHLKKTERLLSLVEQVTKELNCKDQRDCYLVQGIETVYPYIHLSGENMPLYVVRMSEEVAEFICDLHNTGRFEL